MADVDTLPRTETGADLRRLILDHTRHLLITDGYDGLSMRRIARGVGCSATSIYLHFENKDALTHALIDEGMRKLYAALSPGADAAPPDRLEALCRAYVAFGLANPEYYQVMFQLHPERMARYPPEDYRRARRNVELFAETLAEGAATGALRVHAPPPVAAAALWTALHGLVSLLLAERMDVRVAGDAFIDAAIRQALAAFEVREA